MTEKHEFAAADLKPGDDELQRASAICDQIQPFLCGQGPAVQGAVISFLTTLWVTGWQGKELREWMMEQHFHSVRSSMEVINKKDPT